ncbi:MAG: hypothetical protein KDC39_02045 [Actinobacteria bacterium]|nr:hypothetical protein [Actinomycetota bacterium]
MPDEVAAASGPGSAPVELTFPASSEYLALARAATQATCARLNFTIDQLEDVTLAIDEAAALLIGDAVPGTEIACKWYTTATDLTITVTSVSTAGRPPRTTTFSWTVLSALVDRADALFDDGRVTVRLGVRRQQIGTVS